MMTAERMARVVLGILVLAGVAICQTKSVEVHEPAQRLALVIGNAEYAENRLANPVKDAELIEATLEGLGFDDVVLETDLETLPALRGAVLKFGRRLKANDLAFFYYSGHGLQAPGGDRGAPRNYLLPTRYDWKTPLDEVQDNALSFERVRQVLDDAQLRVMVLDACRTYNNKQGKGGEGGGLAPTVAASGELIAFATEPDAVATDEGAPAGIYAQELSGALQQHGLEVAEVFRNVMEGVVERTEGDQHPEHKTKIVGRLYLNGQPSVVPHPPKPDGEGRLPQPDVVSGNGSGTGGRVEVRPPGVGRWVTDWEALKDIKDPAMKGVVEAYIEDYESEPDARLWVKKARVVLATLEERQDAVAAWKKARSAGGRADLVAFVERYGEVAPDLAREAEGMLERLREAELKVSAAGSSWKSPQGMEFAWVPAGRFVMGSPEGEAGRDGDEVQHEVRISEGFWMGRYEVTQGEWEEVMGTNPSMIKACGPRCPVEQVSWFDAEEFIRRLNRRESGSGYEYRLPTEAEWEYAARAGSAGATPEGELRILGKHNAPVLDGQAWYGGNAGVTYESGRDCSNFEETQYEVGRCGTHPVGLKRGNAWGLYDMLGSVWEWTGDWYGDYPSGTVTDPRGPSTGSNRVARGGCWRTGARYGRSANRGNSSPGARGNDIGFRLVRTE